MRAFLQSQHVALNVSKFLSLPEPIFQQLGVLWIPPHRTLHESQHVLDPRSAKAIAVALEH